MLARVTAKEVIHYVAITQLIHIACNQVILMISNIRGSLILAQICISKGFTLKNPAITNVYDEKQTHYLPVLFPFKKKGRL